MKEAELVEFNEAQLGARQKAKEAVMRRREEFTLELYHVLGRVFLI